MKNHIVLFFVVFLLFSCGNAKEKPILPGAEQPGKYLPLLKGKNVALVVNQTSIVDGQHLVDFLLEKHIPVKEVFAPEHGFRGKADAGEELENTIDKQTGLPVISIYGKTKKPSQEQLKGIDWVVFDIQDVGCRFYTFISTMHYVMEACAENGVKMMILDRPNPNGDYVAGPILKPEFRSFVGMDPIPVVHGCTIGELARMINGEGWLTNHEKVDLTVIPVKNYNHQDRYSLPVKPSPNLPNDLSIRLYPSLCFFESTSVSVGRGTHFPFQVLGYPDPKFGSFSFTPESIVGMAKSPLHMDEKCYGEDFRGTKNVPRFTLKYFLDWYHRFPNEKDFLTRERWFNLLMGTDTVIKQIREGKTEQEIRASWQPELNNYRQIRKKYLLYPDNDQN
ncbi:exo-beta-N-acetylmuramidase NamZ domain-containing protein [Prolixibacter sp. NT017]|uniref:exo-beta-N-acetylmuramidase NamZ family protein n=1 Tax=Prolixibacter sp. NT017 TaxID=2652390 RepID=UPI00127DF7D7|nr:DUF1343 domain-containing protein [Prolixibacter sp. NT017]GET27715.1 hypothetical protein NT017_40440 [Prolixibacter sp. NT017]